MMRRGLFGVAAGIAAVLLFGCSLRMPIRYKMKVEVETPEGIRQGYAVREIRFSARANGGDYGQVRGEAVAVDLPHGKALFALLTSGDGDSDYAGDTMSSMFRQADSDRIQLWPDPPQFRKPIVADPLPMLVTFTDASDPTSVARVDPTNLAASFGPGYALRAITVERTRDAVTTEIEKRLAWLLGYRGWLKPAPCDQKNPDMLCNLGPLAFSTEVFK